MKNLIFINGTMGVGKTTTSKELQQLLPHSVFLDGDWCWDSQPFIVTEETKEMVIDNIVYLLNNFLKCSVYENIIFCWVMHEEQIIQEILRRLVFGEYKVFLYSLVCNENALVERLKLDIESGSRQEDIWEKSLSRVKNYESMDTVKVDVSGQTAREAAEWISKNIMS